MNKQMPTGRVTPQAASLVIAQVIPNIIRGVQLDFFVRRGVTQTQFLVVTAIRAYGRCPMGTLARSLHVRMPTVTGIVDRLVRSGHVRRLPYPQDRRQVLVELTAKGRSFFAEFQQVIRRRWEEVLKPLAPAELHAFYHVMTTLQHRLTLEEEPRRP